MEWEVVPWAEATEEMKHTALAFMGAEAVREIDVKQEVGVNHTIVIVRDGWTDEADMATVLDEDMPVIVQGRGWERPTTLVYGPEFDESRFEMLVSQSPGMRH